MEAEVEVVAGRDPVEQGDMSNSASLKSTWKLQMKCNRTNLGHYLIWVWVMVVQFRRMH